MHHLEALGRSRPETGGKTLQVRAAGRFYTPEAVGRRLADDLASALNPQTRGTVLRILDPFGGDGRLLEWLLDALSALGGLSDVALHIASWDVEEDAVLSAT